MISTPLANETPEVPPIPQIPKITLAEVRYSLPELLRELNAERGSAAFAMEKLDQTEIAKLFKAKGARRGKSAK